MTRRVWRTCLTAALALFASCNDKDGNFFIPTPFGPLPINDVTLPIILNQLPAFNIVLNDDGVSFDAVDPPGAPGEPISGINPALVRALLGTQSLPVTRGTGNAWNVDINPLPEGLNTVNIEVPDLAGNRQTGSFTFRKDRTAPRLTWSGPNTGSSSGTSTTINLNGTYSDDNGITQAILYVRRLANGQCLATGDLVPTGTGPGMVSTNRFDLPLNMSTFNLSVTYMAPNNMRPFTDGLCFHYHGEDAARDRLGNPRPNVVDRTWRFDQTWALPPVAEGSVSGRVRVNGTTPLSGITVSTAGKPSVTTDAGGQYTFTNVPTGSRTVTISNVPADVSCSQLSRSGEVLAGQSLTLDFDCVRFSLNVSASYRHIGPGVSETCAAISGQLNFVRGSDPIALENIAGASYQISWTGPGTVGTTSRSGTLNAQSTALDRQQINAFGTYTANVSVTYQGATRQVTANVTVGGTQGTCPAP